jgi:hypothetical protein
VEDEATAEGEGSQTEVISFCVHDGIVLHAAVQYKIVNIGLSYYKLFHLH